MSSLKTANMDKVITALHKSGITNPYSIAGIMSIIAKESGFIPQSEIPYNKTSNARIREIFSKTSNLSDQELTALKASPEKFFNYIYGGRYGNSPTEGYRYRGRGFNQLTFKDNYSKYGKAIGVDLVSNPDLANNPDIAAKIVGAYFNGVFKSNPSLILERYGARNINDFNDTGTAVQAFFNANAGLGRDTRNISSSGKTQALSKVDDLYRETVNFLKSPKGKISLGMVALITIALYRILR